MEENQQIGEEQTPSTQPVNPMEFSQMEQPVQSMESTQAETSFASPVKYAGFWARWVATALDGMIISFLFFILGATFAFIFIAMNKGQDLTSQAFGSFGIAINAGTLLIIWAYFVFMTYKYGATLGKKAVGLRVVSEKSENLSIGQVILRETLGKFISGIIFDIGYIMAAFTERKRALHDMMASTVVVYKDPNKGVPIWTVVVAVILPVLMCGGIIAAIVLVSLNSAREKAQDISSGAILSGANAQAILYEEEHSNYTGFSISDTSKKNKCSGDPIINISEDGKQMAIFIKSCVEKEKYFCVNPETDLGIRTGIEESYVKGGATLCSPDDTAALDVSESEVPLMNAPSGVFNDDVMGFEISYPEGWVKREDFEAEMGEGVAVFSPDRANPSSIIAIQETEIEKDVTQEDLDAMIVLVKNKYKQNNGIISKEENYTYTFLDGTTATGRQFDVEIDQDGEKSRTWNVTVPVKNKVYAFWFTSSIELFDVDKSVAQFMLNSWKIVR